MLKQVQGQMTKTAICPTPARPAVFHEQQVWLHQTHPLRPIFDPDGATDSG